MSIAETRAASNRWGEEVPAPWEQSIAACLASDPARRPHRIANLLDQLRSGLPADRPASGPREPEPDDGPIEHAAEVPHNPDLKPPSEPPPAPPSEIDPPTVDPPQAIVAATPPRPPAKLKSEHQVAAQRSHLRGVLIALAVVAAAFIGLQTFSRRALPPVIPEVKTPGPVSQVELRPIPEPEPGAERVVKPEYSEAVETVQADPTSQPTEHDETSIPAEPPPLTEPIEPVVATKIPAPEPGVVEDPALAATGGDANIASAPEPPEPLRAEPVPSSKPPKSGQRWTNSLGLPFVPVKGLPVLVCVWETRKRDLEAFARATGTKWEESTDGSGPNHPAVNVSFLDATLFCEWLTTVEESTGTLTAGQRYRLPTDEEWSAAAGVVGEDGMSPRERDDQADKSYPWGPAWPPPPTAGNYDGLNPSPAEAADSPPGDLYPRTAPVGMFDPNQFGLFDMGGNVSEMVSDLIEPELGLHATRGGSYRDKDPSVLRLRSRGVGEDTRGRKPQIGFRIVLDPRVKR